MDEQGGGAHAEGTTEKDGDMVLEAVAAMGLDDESEATSIPES
ncbi:MAG TPA: hypothetical protein PKL73_15830 [Polyangiaceae bacterium]|nr:hypothetical protein [Polyangiaceae bacterium]HNZ22313.1 hypothetical protein [Polyangiaceae bacterium]HOD20847.1 hypothetical protein [Polyangiaceae bacterium]HOE49115.1 hypothetical protein [Polyangiaceae bacterium]HOG99982.1 hypothetical protein [Polyangiaceae bacterium]